MPSVLTRQEFFPDHALPVQILPHMVQVGAPLHGHEFSEIAIATSGRGLHVTGRDRWRITQCDVFVISGDRTHALSEVDDLELTNILFIPAVLELAPRRLQALPGYTRLFDPEPPHPERHAFTRRLRLQDDELARVKRHGYQLIDEIQSPLPLRTARVTAGFFRILECLSLAMTRQISAGSATTSAIGKAVAYIDRYYREPLSLQGLAEVAGLSTRSLTRRFRDITGKSPIDYLLFRRLTMAAGLLRDTRHTVTETAYLSGFSDSNYFCRRFKMLHGRSPTDFRRHLP